MACWAFPGSEEFSGEILRSTQAVQAAAVLLLHVCISKDASAPARAQCTFLKALRGWEREGVLCQAWFCTLNTSQRLSKAHILAANLCRSPYHHTSAGAVSCRRVASCTALRCSSKNGVANVHHPPGFGAGCVPNIPGLQDDTGLLTTNSVSTQEQRDGVTSV